MLHTVREWGHLPVRPGQEPDGAGVTRAQADRLLAIAAEAGERLGLGAGSVLVDGRHALRAQQVVGVIPAGSVTVEILPKIDGLDDSGTRAGLIAMLAKVWDLPLSVGEAAHLGHQEETLLEALIALFCRQLFRAVHQGLPRRYRGREDNLPMLRGQLDVRRQFTRLAASPQKLACRFDELDADIALNRIFKAAVSALSLIAHSRRNQRLLSELALAYADIRPVPPGRLPWEEVRHQLDRTNRLWHPLLRLAELLLRRRYQTTSTGGIDGFALLFEMNTLFEAFIGQELRRALRPYGYSVTLQGPAGHALSEADSGAGRFMTRPDICVSRNGRPGWIIDTKWKQVSAANDARHGIQQADVYQMMAYGQVYQADRLMLLYPHHQGLGRDPGIIAGFRVNGAADRWLHVATVDLSDIRRVRAALADLLLEAEQAGGGSGCDTAQFVSPARA